MVRFPVTVTDDFFEDPDSVVEFARQLEYLPAEDGSWPGKRSGPLHLLNPELFQLVCEQTLNLFYNTADLTWNCDVRFQLIDNSYSDGWVHRDRGLVLTNIVYLNKNANLRSGTSIYRKKRNVFYGREMHPDKKEASYLNKISRDEETKFRLENNGLYEETIKVANVYNRMVSFDGNMLHAAQNFSEGEEPRLTMVVFVHSISDWNTPIVRMKAVG